MKYYRVKAKCGHVKRSKYIEKNFYVRANDGKEAAKIVRKKPRVKHDDKYAIKEVEEISLQEYQLGIKTMHEDKYFNVESIQQQRMVNAVNLDDVLNEEKQEKYKTEHNGSRLRLEMA